MKIHGISTAVCVGSLLSEARANVDGTPTTPTKTRNEDSPAASGMQVVTPGVIGAPLRRVLNKDVIDESAIAKVNRKVRNRISNSMEKQKLRVHKLMNRVQSRDTDGLDFTESDEELEEDEGVIEEPLISTRNILKRDDSPYYTETMQNRLTYYLSNITLGSPDQQFMVQVDTGSSDLWVPGRIIQFNGFDPKDSSTFKRLGSDFTIKYVKDSAQGFWGVDTFGFGATQIKVPNLQFAVATSAPDATMGILGIGPLESEVSEIAYPNLPIMMVRTGSIKRAVYSMYMGGLNDNDGTVSFGGSDKAKYRQLTTSPIVSKSTITVELDIVAMTTSTGPKSREGNVLMAEHESFTNSSSKFDEEANAESREEEEEEEDIFASEFGYFTNEMRSEIKPQLHDVIVSQQPINVLLDTGTSLTYLPTALVQAIASQFKATYDSSVGMYVVHEDDVNNSPLQGINFQFQNQIVYMPKSELFWPLSWFSLSPSPYYAMTLLGSETSLGYNILGDSFLRNAYVIYDSDEKEVHIGQYFPSPYSHVVPL